MVALKTNNNKQQTPAARLVRIAKEEKKSRRRLQEVLYFSIQWHKREQTDQTVS